ncbi:MAG: hypothetical protein WKG01_38755 [Kofleriaceae bacterium]
MWLIAFTAMALGTSLAPRVANADDLKVHVQVKTQDPAGKNKNDAPMIEATIIDGPNVPLEKFSLFESNARLPVSLKAISKREYNKGTDTIAIALVVCGQEIWIGNDEVEPTGGEVQGVLKNLTS